MTETSFLFRQRVACRSFLISSGVLSFQPAGLCFDTTACETGGEWNETPNTKHERETHKRAAKKSWARVWALKAGEDCCRSVWQETEPQQMIIAQIASTGQKSSAKQNKNTFHNVEF